MKVPHRRQKRKPPTDSTDKTEWNWIGAALWQMNRRKFREILRKLKAIFKAEVLVEYELAAKSTIKRAVKHA